MTSSHSSRVNWLAPFYEGFEVEFGELNGLEFFNIKGVVVVFDIVVRHRALGPDAALEDTIIFRLVVARR